MKKIAIASAVALALSASSAFAVTAQTGFFVTGGAGVGQLDTPTKNMPDGYGYKNFGFSWNGGVGFQQALSQNFSVGLEFGYNQLGTASITPTSDQAKIDIKNTAWQLLGNATYLWNSGWNVLVNAGAVRVKQDITGGLSNKETATKFAAGFGVGYQFTQEFGTNVSWLHVFGKDNSDGNNYDPTKISSSNTFTLNLVYTFPV
jgi:opacity protein-like surface antigen